MKETLFSVEVRLFHYTEETCPFFRKVTTATGCNLPFNYGKARKSLQWNMDGTGNIAFELTL